MTRATTVGKVYHCVSHLPIKVDCFFQEVRLAQLGNQSVSAGIKSVGNSPIEINTAFLS